MKMHRGYAAFACAALCLASVSFASAQGGVASTVSAFQEYADVLTGNIRIAVPTVVEVPFSQDFLERTDFAVFDMATNRFEPSLFVQSVALTPLVAETKLGQVLALTDGNSGTSEEFEVPGDRAVKTRIIVTADRPISSSAFSVALPNNVALPEFIALWADGRVVVAERRLDATTVHFPETQSRIWQIEFTHIQPLRIGEIRFVESRAATGARSLRFLAQPGHDYRVYFNPDTAVYVPTGESGNLSGDSDIRRVVKSSTKSNPGYIQSDGDTDGIPDLRDNCVSVANSDQSDIDANGLGDLCQDFDRDGVSNARDNCVEAPNGAQEDTDGDGSGDACDSEESRFTEKHAWVPWVGIGFAAAVIALLFALALYSRPPTPPAVPNQ